MVLGDISPVTHRGLAIVDESLEVGDSLYRIHHQKTKAHFVAGGQPEVHGGVAVHGVVDAGGSEFVTWPELHCRVVAVI